MKTSVPESNNIYRLKMCQMPVGTIVIIEKHLKVDARKKNNTNRVRGNTSAYGFSSILIMKHIECAKHLFAFADRGCRQGVIINFLWKLSSLPVLCSESVWGLL